jgi:release factor glutamine methyltransferase
MTDGGTVRQALTRAAARLAGTSETPRLDAELLLAHALGIPRETLLLSHLDDAVPKAFQHFLARRMDHEPVAYITGKRDFWTISLSVTPDVLIPRPDTETLVEAAIEGLSAVAAPRFLDLGTGSGALLLAALDQWRDGWGVGVDKSLGALRIASANAAELGMSRRTAFLQGDWSAALGGRFDGIFCNPPYIEQEAALPRDVVGYEPHAALFAGVDGLDDYRRLIPLLPDLLAEEGLAFLEIGSRQAQAVLELGRAGGLAGEVRPDLAGLDRCVILRKA